MTTHMKEKSEEKAKEVDIIGLFLKGFMISNMPCSQRMYEEIKMICDFI
jgi:hypothetical protein